MEEIYIKKIEAGIRSIRFGLTKPADSKVGYFLNKLKPLNPGMYDELLNNYKAVTLGLVK